MADIQDVEGNTCPSCDAHNPDDAAHCWRCYTRFVDTPSRNSILQGLHQPRYQGLYTGATQVTSLTRSVAPVLHVLRGLFIVGALVVVAVWGWNAVFDGFPFPDYVSAAERAERVESEFIDSGTEIVDDMIAATGIEVDIEYAFYGTEEQLRYMIFAADSGSDGLRNALESQAPGGRGGIHCFPDGTDSFCFWTREDMLVGLYGWGEADSVLRVVAEHTRSNMA